MVVSVPGHSPLKFKQIDKIKESLVLETCILVDRQQHASVIVSSQVVATCLRGMFFNRETNFDLTLFRICLLLRWLGRPPSFLIAFLGKR